MISMAVISRANTAKAGSGTSGPIKATCSPKKCKFEVTPEISGGSVEFSTQVVPRKSENVVFVMMGGLQQNGLPL